ncbi:MAG: acyl-CoA dehydrogenase family protein [Gammaproteobacteria bacterium]|nr:acyl-CoA dehydrogenase family protein [Gammaproteobacteria bacterium]
MLEATVDILGINKQFSEEELLIAKTVRDFADSNLIPMMTEHYEKASMPEDLIEQIASLGLFGMTLPVEHGGSAATNVAYGLACAELERADSAVRSFVSVQSSLCMYPIFKYGTEEQKTKYLLPMSQGRIIGCFGLTEPDSGSDPASMKTTATPINKDRLGAGGWLLKGSKMWITNAPIAHLGIIWAKTPDGIRGFLIDMQSKGVKTQLIKHKMSLRASITGEISFNDVFVPEDAILPGTTKGLGAALGCLTQARYGIAWGAIGAAEFCLDQTVEYAKTRKQFERPIASNQLIQKQLVDCYTEICKAKLFNLNLGRLKDANPNAAELNISVSMAKMNACREALKIARTCRNVLGANGISLEYHVIRHMNNLESVFTYEGTDNIHTLAIGRFLTGINAF